jgi:predicted nucleotidyltransferase
LIIQDLEKRGLIHPPKWLSDNCHYLTIMGSVAYGVSSDTSDCDIYGWVVPPKHLVFPHLAGEILGFGAQIKKFDQWQQHHINDREARKEYDFSVYNIVRYFHLCMGGNPNMIDSLWTPTNCVIHSTTLSEMVRDHRRLFVSKKMWHTYKGYAFSQLHKMSSKDPEPESKRAKLREELGWDVKFGYHVVRLLLEIEQLLQEGDMDLQAHKEHLKAIRRGEVTEQEVRDFFTLKEKELEKLYHESNIPYSPDEAAIKKLLLECLEHHYGNLDGCIEQPDQAVDILRQIQEILDRSRNLMR